MFEHRQHFRQFAKMMNRRKNRIFEVTRHMFVVVTHINNNKIIFDISPTSFFFIKISCSSSALIYFPEISRGLKSFFGDNPSETISLRTFTDNFWKSPPRTPDFFLYAYQQNVDQPATIHNTFRSNQSFPLGSRSRLHVPQ